MSINLQQYQEGANDELINMLLGSVAQTDLQSLINDQAQEVNYDDLALLDLFDEDMLELVHTPAPMVRQNGSRGHGGKTKKLLDLLENDEDMLELDNPKAPMVRQNG